MYFRPYYVITSHAINLQTALVGASIPKILSEAYFRHEDCRCLGITEQDVRVWPNVNSVIQTLLATLRTIN